MIPRRDLIRLKVNMNFWFLMSFVCVDALEFPGNYDEQPNGLLGNRWVQRFSTVLNYQPPELYRKRFKSPYFTE